MNAAHAFAIGGVPLEAIIAEHPGLAGRLSTFEPLKVATAYAALLTVPELQSNCLRLEALVQLGLAFGAGARKPQPKHLMRWFADLGTGRCGAFEDPAEDVFVGVVATPRGNFRVLEGIWESGNFYLQRVIDVVEKMPTGSALGALRESVYALLRLSEAVSARASLSRHELGSPTPSQFLPVKFANTMDGLRRRVRFSQANLAELGISGTGLREFIIDPGDPGRFQRGRIGHTLLERYPLMWDGGAYHFLLPTATSAAIRRFVFERMNELGILTGFLDALADEYAHLMRNTPLLGGSSNAPVQFQRLARRPVGSVTTTVDEGRYLNFVFFVDTLNRFSETGLTHPNPDPEELGNVVGRLIDTSQQKAGQQPDFRDGLSIAVGCGIGRATAICLDRKERAHWRVEFLSAADLITLSWLPEMSPLFLWKLREAQERLAALGVELQNANGLLNLVAWVRSQRGHLVPHAEVPADFVDGDSAKFIVIEQNALRRLRHEAATSWDAQVLQNTQGEWVKVRKPEQSLFKEDLAPPLYASEDCAKTRWPLGVYLTDSRP